MSYETASFSSSRSISPPVLPSYLHLTGPQKNSDNDNDSCSESKLSVKSFGQAFHHIVLPRRFDKVDRLERVAEDEDAICSTRPSDSMKHGLASSRFSTTSLVSQSTVFHTPTRQRSLTTLIAPFPSLNVSDIPSRSPTNKSPFSAVLLAEAGEDEDEDEEDDPASALWQSERLYRARLAKLTRHLGEEIPTEMVLSPTVLGQGSSRSSVHSPYGYRGYHHNKHRSVDPSVFRQESSVTGSTEGFLRNCKSLEAQGDAPSPLSMAVITSETLDTVHAASGVLKAETTVIPTQAQPLGLTLETQSNIPTNNILHDDGVLHERRSTDTCSDSLCSRSLHETSSETPPFSFAGSTSPVPRKSKVRPRRPATTDGTRRVEKLANFFGVGVNDENISVIAQACGRAKKFRSLSAIGGKDLIVGNAPVADSKLEVEVKIVNRRSGFWNGGATTRRIHPNDVRNRLRSMKAS